MPRFRLFCFSCALVLALGGCAPAKAPPKTQVSIECDSPKLASPWSTEMTNDSWHLRIDYAAGTVFMLDSTDRARNICDPDVCKTRIDERAVSLQKLTPLMMGRRPAFRIDRFQIDRVTGDFSFGAEVQVLGQKVQSGPVTRGKCHEEQPPPQVPLTNKF